MRKFFYILLLGSVIFIFSCNNTFNLGKDILPSGDFVDVQITDTVTLKMYTEKSPDIVTSSPEYLLLGKFDDPIFGTTESSFMSQVFQYSYPEWSDSAVFDSICLGLPLADDYYFGNSPTLPEVTVYKVSDTLYNKIYYSNEDPSEYTEYEVLGYGKMRFFTPIDSTENTIKGLQLRLSDSLGQEFMNNSEDYFESYGSFYNLFKGIYVKCNNNSGLYKINSSSDDNTKNFGIVIYYHEPDKPDSLLRFVLPITSSAVRFNMFTHDYSTGTINNIIEADTPVLAEKLYLQPMAGTIVKFTAPGVRNLKDIAILNAELYLKTDPSASIYPYSPLPTVWFTVYDTTMNYAFLNDYLTDANTYEGANYNSLTGEYEFNVTRIIQNYIDTVYQNQDLTLYLFDYKAKSDIGRTVFYNGLEQATRSKLVITYTKLK